MNYNNLTSYSIKALNKELQKQNRIMVLNTVGLLMLMSILLFRYIETDKMNWTILLPLSFLLFIWNTSTRRRDLQNAMKDKLN